MHRLDQPGVPGALPHVRSRRRSTTEVAKLPTRPLDFCMDRFEYPNVLGQNPIIVVTFHEAEALCKKSKQATLQRERVDVRVRRRRGPAVSLRLHARRDGMRRRSQLAAVRRRRAPAARRRRRTRRARSPLAGRALRRSRRVQEPLRRLRHDRQRRRVDAQRSQHRLLVHPQGRLLGPRPRALSARDARAQRGLRRVPARLSLLRRRRHGRARASPRARTSRRARIDARSPPTPPVRRGSGSAGPTADLSTEWDNRASDDADEVESHRPRPRRPRMLRVEACTCSRARRTRRSRHPRPRALGRRRRRRRRRRVR